MDGRIDSPANVQYGSIKASSQTELILRNTDRISFRVPLVIGPPSPVCVKQLTRSFPSSRFTFLFRDYAVYRGVISTNPDKWNGSKPNFRFNAWYIPKVPLHDGVILYLPKGKELTAMSLSMARLCLSASPSESCRIMIVGQKNAGIQSLPSLVSDAEKVEKIDSARHCVLFSLNSFRSTDPATMKRGWEEEWAKHWQVKDRENNIQIVSYPGVFSHGRLDEGTKILLEILDIPKNGRFLDRVLDVGCGSGFIGAAISKRSPDCSVEMTDTCPLAIESANRTIELNGLANAFCYPSDLFSDVRGKFSLIVSNPPFHRGTVTEYSVSRSLIEQAGKHLGKDGTLQIVANRFLKYHPLLLRVFREVDILYEDNRFRVYRAHRPNSAVRSK